MKQIATLLVLLVLVGALSAATYAVQVDMPILANLTRTQDAELAFASTGNTVANDFVKDVTTNGGAKIVQFDFGNVQPDSVYTYSDALRITNNKPYAVTLGATWIHGSIQNLFKEGKSNFTMTCGGVQMLQYADGTGNSVKLEKNSSVTCSFTLASSEDAIAGNYDGRVEFTATSNN